MTDDPTSFAVSGGEVEWVLGEWNMGYCNNRRADVALRDVPAIPYLWTVCQQHGGLPLPNDLVDALMAHPKRTPNVEEYLLHMRAVKLTQDFLRDLHTMCQLREVVGGVIYKGAFDLDKGVDFECRSPRDWHKDSVFGVQATMRAYWNENYSEIKESRRLARHGGQYPHPLFVLSNEGDERRLNAGGVWLFQADQIVEFVQHVRAQLARPGRIETIPGPEARIRRKLG